MGASITKLLRWKDPSHLEDGEANDRVLQKVRTQAPTNVSHAIGFPG